MEFLTTSFFSIEEWLGILGNVSEINRRVLWRGCRWIIAGTADLMGNFGKNWLHCLIENYFCERGKVLIFITAYLIFLVLLLLSSDISFRFLWSTSNKYFHWFFEHLSSLVDCPSNELRYRVIRKEKLFKMWLIIADVFAWCNPKIHHVWLVNSLFHWNLLLRRLILIGKLRESNLLKKRFINDMRGLKKRPLSIISLLLIHR